MSAIFASLRLIAIPFEIIGAGFLAYAIATSHADSRKVIKDVLIGTAMYIIVSILFGAILPYVVFPIIFCIFGAHTGNKFNVSGFFALIAFFVSLFILPVVSNKHEDSIGYQLVEGTADELGISLTPTQYEIWNDYSGLSGLSENIEKYFGIMAVMAVGLVLFAIFFFNFMLLRKNTAQMITGGIMAFFAAGILYMDYCIFNSDSLGGKLAAMALSKAGFSLSVWCIFILLLAVLPAYTAYRCDKKMGSN